MSISTIFVAPDMLAQFAAWVPPTVRIVGSLDCPDYVALRIESDLFDEEAGPVTAQVSVDGLSRTITLKQQGRGE